VGRGEVRPANWCKFSSPLDGRRTVDGERDLWWSRSPYRVHRVAPGLPDTLLSSARAWLAHGSLERKMINGIDSKKNEAAKDRLEY
jgi:hypothetical protein